jgi:hypothetical protein
MTVGNLEEINTTGSLQGETWADGDVLYLSPTTAGAITNVKPTGATGHIVVIGYVEYAHAIHGKIYVKVMNGWELDELHNVYIDTPVNNNVLTYESSTSLWKNKTVATALGYTPVPETRTLTINGTTQDLSANRTFTIATGLTVGTTPITSGTVGRVLFEGTGNVLQESANFFWDNTNGRLGIGTTTPTQKLEVNGAVKTTSVQASGISTLSTCFMYGYLTEDNNSNRIYLNANELDFWTNGGSSLRITKATKNVLIGTTTDAGYKLDVNGTARVSGTTLTLSANNPQIVWNTGAFGLYYSSTRLMRVDYLGSYQLQQSLIVSASSGTAINASAILEGNSTTKGFLPPRMTTTQKNAIATPAAGLVVYDTTLNKLCVYTTAWETITSV